jgi:hypothetical protein
MQRLLLLSYLVILSCSNPQNNAGQQLLAKAISYHDPENNWSKLKTHLYLSSVDTAGSENPFELEIDNAIGYFCHISHDDGKEIVKGVSKGKDFFLIDGKKEFSEEDRKKYELTSESVKWVHSFYGYLYGLPMKLTDEGASVTSTIVNEEVNGKKYPTIRVSYNPAVGKDNWFFYCDAETSALKAYRFNHGTPESGEFILLEEELTVSGIKLPKIRKWYLNKDNKYLGTDNLIKAEKLTAYRN